MLLHKGRIIMQAFETRRGQRNKVNELEFEQIIVNGALDNMAGTAPASLSGICFVGTGTTAPVATDSTLQNELTPFASGGSSINAVSPSAPFTHSLTRTYSFAQGAINNVLANIGFFNLSSPSKELFSATLIEDDMGEPTTFTVTASQQLVVTYVLERTVPNVNGTGSFTIDGVTYNYTSSAANAQSTSSWGLTLTPHRVERALFYGTQTLGDITAGLTGPTIGSGNPTLTAGTYVAGSRQLVTSLNIPANNFDFTTAGGCGGMLLGRLSAFPYKVVFDTKIPKTLAQEIDIPDFMTTSWDRA